MADTSALVPIGTAGIGVAGALLGAWLQGRLARQSREAEGRQAEGRQAREWAKDSYVRLIEAIDRAERGMGRGKAFDEETLPYAEPSLWKEEGGRLMAEVIALGSSEVKELVERFQAKHVEFYILLGDIQQMRKSGDRPLEEMRELREMRKAIFQLARDTEDQIRRELRPTL